MNEDGQYFLKDFMDAWKLNIFRFIFKNRKRILNLKHLCEGNCFVLRGHKGRISNFALVANVLTHFIPSVSIKFLDSIFCKRRIFSQHFSIFKNDQKFSFAFFHPILCVSDWLNILVLAVSITIKTQFFTRKINKNVQF